MLHAKNAKCIQVHTKSLAYHPMVRYDVKDKYSHQLKRPVPANQVVHYYGDGGFCMQSQLI